MIGPNIITRPCAGIMKKDMSIDMSIDLKKLTGMNIGPSTVFSFHISPGEYHRFHSPTTSKLIHLHTINSNNIINVPVIFNKGKMKNYRKILVFANGVIMVLIGSLFVGSIKFSEEFYQICRNGGNFFNGVDMGYFEFGGSAIVLILPI